MPAVMDQSTFADRLEDFGDHVAIVADSGRSLTYAELAAAADAFAAKLTIHRPLLAIEAHNEVEAIAAYLGALRRKAPVLLLGPDADLNARILATYPVDLLYRKGTGGWVLEQRDIAGAATHPELGLLLSTSGTTGAAKLVRLARSALEANARSIASYLGITADDRAITTLPIHYSYGLSVVNSHLACGARILLTERSVIDKDFWAFFDAEAATSMAGVPYTYELLERVGLRDRPPRSLRTLTQAGGRLPVDLMRSMGAWAAEHGVKFFVMYGQTEATARMAYVPPDRLMENLGSIGVPIPGGAFELADEAGVKLTALEAEGELVYRGANIMMGYATCAEDLARGAELEELHTGDLARRTPEGFHYIVGRKSRFSKLFGLRVGLDELETALAAGGHRAFVSGNDEVISIAVVAPSLEQDVRDILSDRYALPAASFFVYQVEQPPVLPSGKIDYRSILEAAQATRTRDQGEGVSGAFARAFAGKPITDDDSFVTLGGDSLNYVTLSIELEEKLGFLPTRWEERSIGELKQLRAAPVKKRGLFSLRTLETEVLVRALAILAVVVNHASDLVVSGGAEALLLLAGYNIARYQKGKFQEGAGFDVLKSFTQRIIFPYYVIVLLYAALKPYWDAPSLLLVSNFYGRFGSLLEPYWFLEALFQCMLIVVVLMAIPPLRRVVSAHLWGASLTFFGAVLALKFGIYLWLGRADLMGRTPDAVLYLFAFGICLQQADTLRRRVLLSLAALGVAVLDLGVFARGWETFPYPSNITHAVWLVCATVALIWTPRIRLPQFVRVAAASVAAASFYIYLTHGLPVFFIREAFGAHSLALSLTTSVVVGLVIWRLMERFVQDTATTTLRRAAAN